MQCNFNSAAEWMIMMAKVNLVLVTEIMDDSQINRKDKNSIL